MYIFKISYWDKMFKAEYTDSFEKAISWTGMEMNEDFSAMEIKELTEDFVIWSNPGGFTAHAVLCQGCKTTDESTKIINSSKQKRVDTILAVLIKKYCNKNDIKVS